MYSMCTVRTVCTVCTYACTHLIPSTWYLVLGMHSYACVCIPMHSYASVTHPYTPICFHARPLRIQMQTLNRHVHTNLKTSTQRQTRKIIIAIGSGKSVRIQPNIPNRLQQVKGIKQIRYGLNSNITGHMFTIDYFQYSFENSMNFVGTYAVPYMYLQTP